MIHLARGDWTAANRAHRLGVLFAAALLVQIPYRLYGLHRRDPEPLGRLLPSLFGYVLIIALVGNWLYNQLPAAARLSEARQDQAPGKKVMPVRPELVLEHALRAADQITVPWMKAQALADIAAAQARLGQAEPARATFQRVAEIIDEGGDDAFFRVANLSWLAKAQATTSDRARVRATIAQIIEWAPKIGDDGKRQTLLQIAAARQAKAGDAEGALNLLLALNGGTKSLRASVLAEIGGAGQCR